MTLTLSFLLPAFEFALFPSQHSSPLPLLPPPPSPPSLGYLPSGWCCKTGPRHLHRCRDVLPQIFGPARQPLGALQPPSAHQHNDPPRPPVPRTRPRSLDSVTPRRAGRSSEDSWGHPCFGPGATRLFPVPAGDRWLRVSVFTPASWITLLLFLYRLLFAADGGERRAGRAAWGMGAEGSWTPINPEKKSLAGPQVGWRGWRGRRAGVSVQCARDQCVASWRAASLARALPGAGRRPGWVWREAVAVRAAARASAWRARAAENQEVTAAKRTDVFDRRDMTRAREEEEVAGAGPRAPA